MKQSMRILMVVLLSLMVIISPTARAKSNQGQGLGQEKEYKEKNIEKWTNRVSAKGYKKLIDSFTEIDSEQVEVNGNGVKFDVPPVIKEGRTLIPVRAITEGLGGTVDWDPDNYIVTIGSPDGLVIIYFYLEDGSIQVIDDRGTETESYWATTDVSPGLINNRTFVPLRFIAETFGLKVGYNYQNGKIDICSDPKIIPEKVTYLTEASVPEETAVGIKLHGYKFDGIDGLTEGVDYTTEPGLNVVLADCTTDVCLVVYIKDDYILSLTDEETELDFLFSLNEDITTVTFEIELKYNDAEPSISPEKVNYIEGDIDIDVLFNGYDLNSLRLEEKDGSIVDPDNYEVYEDSVTILESYLTGFDQEEVELIFEFQKDSKIEFEALEIKFDDYEEEEEETSSTLQNGRGKGRNKDNDDDDD